MKKQEVQDFIIFNNGRIFVRNVGCILIPSHIFVIYYRIFGDLFRELLYDAGRLQAGFLASRSRAEKKLTNVREFLGLLESFGYGRFELVSTNFDTPLFRMKNVNSTVAGQFIKMFGPSKQPVDSYLCGMLSGFFSRLTGIPMDTVETSCIAQGKGSCVFEVRKGEAKRHSRLDELPMIKELTGQGAKKPMVGAAIVRRAFLESLSYHEGKISLWNKNVIMMPVSSFIMLHTSIKTILGARGVKLIYGMGKFQSRTSTEYHIHMYGRKSSKELYYSMIEQSELIGVGSFSVTGWSDDEIIIKAENCPFSEFKKLMPPGDGKREHNYIQGLGAGITEAILGWTPSVRESPTEISERGGSFRLSITPSDQDKDKEFESLLGKDFSTMQFLG